METLLSGDAFLFVPRSDAVIFADDFFVDFFVEGFFEDGFFADGFFADGFFADGFFAEGFFFAYTEVFFPEDALEDTLVEVCELYPSFSPSVNSLHNSEHSVDVPPFSRRKLIQPLISEHKAACLRIGGVYDLKKCTIYLHGLRLIPEYDFIRKLKGFRADWFPDLKAFNLVNCGMYKPMRQQERRAI